MAAVGTWVWVLWAGKDLSWDVLNHHLYLPFSWWTGRYREDLFGAGSQSYQNPFGYLPFFLLWKSGLPAVALGTLLSWGHAAAAWPLHSIACRLWPRPEHRPWRLLGVAAALVGPPWLLVVGTTSIDPWGALFTVAALALLMQPGLPALSAALAGALMGVAVAIKTSSLVLIPAVAVVALLQAWAQRQWPWRPAAAFVAALLAALAAVAGPWSIWLYQTFASPTFPLFNDLFRSPFAPVGPTVAVRFLPEGLGGAAWRLVEMLDMRAFVTTEYFTPDARPLVAALATTAAVGMAALRAWHGSRGDGWRALAARPALQLAAFVACAYIAWIFTSANARYALALFLAVGLLMVKAVHHVLGSRGAAVALGTVLLLQTAVYVSDGNHRGAAEPWSDARYFGPEVPERLRREPFLHVSIEAQTMASLALEMHPDGALISLLGQWTMPTDGPLGQALQQRLDRWAGRTRLLLRPLADTGRPGGIARQQARLDRVFAPYGLQVDWSDCLPFGPGPGAHLTSCRANRLPLVAHVPSADDRRAAEAIQRVEAGCPRILGPRPLATERGEDAWMRTYGNSDAWLRVSMTEGVTIGHFRSTRLAYLGSVDDVLEGRYPAGCRFWKELTGP